MCPICSGERTRVAYPLVDCDLHACRDCSHVFSQRKAGVEPEAYGDDYYLERHREYFENPDTALLERTLRRLERHWKSGGSVVDVGCGTGNWLALLQKNGYRPYGIEMSAAAADVARGRGFDVACASVAEYEPPVAFDGLVSWYVVEHVEAIRDFFAGAARILPAGGVAAIATVDSGSLVYTLGKLLHRGTLGVLRAPLQRICEVHHVQHFTRRSLDTVLQATGFEILERFSAPFPAGSVNTSALQRMLLRIAYAMAGPIDSHFIQVVIARRATDARRAERP